MRRLDTGRAALIPGLSVRVCSVPADEELIAKVVGAPGRCISADELVALHPQGLPSIQWRPELLPTDGRVQVDEGIVGISVARDDPRVEVESAWYVHVPTVREFWVPARFRGRGYGSLLDLDGHSLPVLGRRVEATDLVGGSSLPIDPESLFDDHYGVWLPNGSVALEVADDDAVGLAVLDVPAFEDFSFEVVAAPRASVPASASLTLRLEELPVALEVFLQPRGLVSPALWSEREPPAWRPYVFPEVRFEHLPPGRYGLYARPADEPDATPVEVAWTFLRTGEAGEVTGTWPTEPERGSRVARDARGTIAR